MGQYFVRLTSLNCRPYTGHESYRYASRDSVEFFQAIRNTRFFGYKYNDHSLDRLSGPDVVNFTVPLDILYPNPQELIRKFTEKNVNKVKFLCQHFGLEITLSYGDWEIKSDNEYDYFYKSIPSKFRTIADGYGVRGSYPGPIYSKECYTTDTVRKEEKEKAKEEEGKLKESLFKPKIIKLKQDE